MVRALAQTARGVGLGPTQCYTLSCFGLFGDNIIINDDLNKAWVLGSELNNNG